MSDLELLLKEYRKEQDEVKAKNEKLLSELIELLGDPKTGNTYEISDALGPYIARCGINSSESLNLLAERIMGVAIIAKLPEIYKHVQVIQKRFVDFEDEPTFYIGDADVYFELIRNWKDKFIFRIRDVVTCNDTNKWVVIDDKQARKLHVRHYSTQKELTYYTKSSAKYYGDFRDPGYVLSYDYGYRGGDVGRWFHFYSEISFFAMELEFARFDIEEN